MTNMIKGNVYTASAAGVGRSTRERVRPSEQSRRKVSPHEAIWTGPENDGAVWGHEEEKGYSRDGVLAAGPARSRRTSRGRTIQVIQTSWKVKRETNQSQR